MFSIVVFISSKVISFGVTVSLNPLGVKDLEFGFKALGAKGSSPL